MSLWISINEQEFKNAQENRFEQYDSRSLEELHEVLVWRMLNKEYIAQLWQKKKYVEAVLIITEQLNKALVKKMNESTN